MGTFDPKAGAFRTSLLRDRKDAIETRQAALDLARRVRLDSHRSFDLALAVSELTERLMQEPAVPFSVSVRVLEEGDASGLEVSAQGYANGSAQATAGRLRTGLSAVRGLLKDLTVDARPDGTINIRGTQWSPRPA